MVRLIICLGMLLLPVVLICQDPIESISSYPNKYNMLYDVELIPQTTNVSCWAAATAMIVGWRDMVILNPEDIADGVGYWAQYNHKIYKIDKLLPPDDLNMFEVWGLVPETRLSFSLKDVANLLWEYGPLWVATSTYQYANSNYGHIRVVIGLSGDGTDEGTLVYINDPWGKNMKEFRFPNSGSHYTETFKEFIGKLNRLQELEKSTQPNAIYIAHP